MSQKCDSRLTVIFGVDVGFVAGLESTTETLCLDLKVAPAEVENAASST